MKGQIFIQGQIGSFNSIEGVELIDIIAQVKKQPKATSFEIYINSVGGLVKTGFDIYNYIKSLGLPITTIGNGVVASVATIPFMAGQKRIVQDGTKFMIHLPMAGVHGTAEEIAAYANDIKAVEDKIIALYVQEYKMQREAIEPLLKNETWLTSAQLFDLGITTNAPLQIAAMAIITKIPTQMEKKKEKSLLTQIFNLIKNEATSKILYDAENREVIFPTVEDGQAVAIGDIATIEDKPATGEVLMADGRKLIFVSGKLDKIMEKVEEQTQDAKDLAAIKLTLAALEVTNKGLVADKTALETEKTTLETANAEMISGKETAETELKKLQIVMAKIKGYESEFEAGDDGKDRKKKKENESRFATAMANLK